MGMRELKSSGITPVKRAYAIFDVESLETVKKNI
jgi:hypothetical protein